MKKLFLLILMTTLAHAMKKENNIDSIFPLTNRPVIISFLEAYLHGSLRFDSDHSLLFTDSCNDQITHQIYHCGALSIMDTLKNNKNFFREQMFSLELERMKIPGKALCPDHILLLQIFRYNNFEAGLDYITLLSTKDPEKLKCAPSPYIMTLTDCLEYFEKIEKNDSVCQSIKDRIIYQQAFKQADIPKYISMKNNKPALYAISLKSNLECIQTNQTNKPLTELYK